MGIWTDVFIAPAEPGLLVPRADFERLLLDLGRERLVVMPWVLLAGRLCVNASLNWGSVSGKARWDRTLPPGTVLATDEPWPEDRDDNPPPWGDSHEEARILARGDGILGLLAAVREAPYGVEDIAAVFAGVDFGHRGIADWFRWEDHRTTVACFALASAQNRPLSTPDWADPSSRVHPVRTCLVHTFKHRFRYFPAPPLAAVAGRHLGAEPVVGETWG
ncbi:hypothetical protein EF912_19990 [Streptomyces sp. WAC07061]|uniref:hypothetical protein n=1 Tax=Streptomyces sp. WAC07061 TaxID=2487410 RepID=UPI000F7A9451|nr:hypothetical protein [Streptomyces sp. WAC07061]RSS52207.1 hypothetical protein EF912_19990 [Streptomyces sp. WAC07061]